MVERLTSNDAAAALAEGRAAVERRAWREAHDALSRADGVAPLAAADLELLAVAAYLLGEDDAYVEALERAHRSHLDEGATRLRRRTVRRQSGWRRAWLPGARGAALRRAARSRSCRSVCGRPPRA